MVYLVIFIILACFAAVLYLVKINAVIDYVRNDNDDNIVLSFYTMKGIFKYKYEIPLVDLGKKGVKFKLVKERGKKDKKISEKHERLKITEIFDKYVLFKEYYEVNKDLICDIKDYLKERLVLKEFKLYIKVGTGDAFYTGIVCGLLWSLTGLITTFLSNSFKVFKKCVSIKPNYGSSVFIVDFYCIFHIKLVHIIVLVTKIYFNNYKVRKAIAKKIGGDLSG